MWPALSLEDDFQYDEKELKIRKHLPAIGLQLNHNIYAIMATLPLRNERSCQLMSLV